MILVPVKQDLYALLWLARCKGGDYAAACLPLTFIQQGQVIIAPEHTTTPECSMSSPAAAACDTCGCEQSNSMHGTICEQVFMLWYL